LQVAHVATLASDLAERHVRGIGIDATPVRVVENVERLSTELEADLFLLLLDIQWGQIQRLPPAEPTGMLAFVFLG